MIAATKWRSLWRQEGIFMNQSTEYTEEELLNEI